MTKTTPPVECPACHRALISRLVDYCQYCSAPLPPELRLPEGHKERLREQERIEDETRTREERRRSEQERERRAREGESGGADFFVM